MIRYSYRVVLSSKSFLLLFLLTITLLTHDLVSRVLIKSTVEDNGATIGIAQAYRLPTPVVSLEESLQLWPAINEQSETMGKIRTDSAASIRTKDGVYQLMAVYSNSNDTQNWYANIRFTDLNEKVTQKLLRDGDKIGSFALTKIGIGSVSLEAEDQNFTLFLFELNKRSEEKPK